MTDLRTVLFMLGTGALNVESALSGHREINCVPLVVPLQGKV
jgi:hypothetical protein